MRNVGSVVSLIKKHSNRQCVLLTFDEIDKASDLRDLFASITPVMDSPDCSFLMVGSALLSKKLSDFRAYSGRSIYVCE